MISKLKHVIAVTAVALIPVLWGAQSASADEKFDAWLVALKTEALSKGISEPVFNAAFAKVKLLKRVVNLDRKQPEVTQTFEQYMSKRLPQELVNKGRKQLAENRDALEAVSKIYGVQPRFIVALWGVETRFGTYTGGFSVINALTTLAYDARRAAYFRKELLLALQILEEGHISLEDFKGSWAGAMGQAQFMPSSFVNFAVDHDGDGRRDIWTTKPDVFASAANYLSKSGWKGDQTWGREVTIPADLSPDLISLKVKKSLADWQAIGVRKKDGTDLSAVNMTASLVQPKGGNGQTFIVYNNYRTILKWNRSTYFAMSVGMLADRLAGG